MCKVLYINVKKNKPLIGRIFWKFDGPKLGNSRKDGWLLGESKHFFPNVETKPFP